jgi:hypothetical protein
MSKSTKRENPDHITIEEAASILRCGQHDVQRDLSRGTFKKLRASNGEVRLSRVQVQGYRDHIDRIVAEAPPISDERLDQIAVLLRPNHVLTNRGPSPAQLERERQEAERQAAFKEASRMAATLMACDACDQPPEAHGFQNRLTLGFHEWVPGRAAKIMAGAK